MEAAGRVWLLLTQSAANFSCIYNENLRIKEIYPNFIVRGPRATLCYQYDS